MGTDGTMVGVDLGGTSVRVAYVVRRGGRVQSVHAARRPLPRPDAPPAERRDHLARALEETVRALGVAGRQAAVCVTGGDVLVRRMTLPRMSRADVRRALELECRKMVNFPAEEAELRYEVVDEGARADGSNGLNLLVSVARRRRVEEARDLLTRAGLTPALVTTAPAALRAHLRERGATREAGVVAYLDMGLATTHILVLKGDEVRFSRESGVGGAAFTDALRAIVVPGRGTVDLTAEEAESLKRAHGIPLGAEEAEAAGDIPLSAVSVMLRPALERLARELWNSFDYCHEQYLGEAVSRVVLLGEGSRLRNLPDYLAGVLRIPVECAAAERPDGASEIALGLAHLPQGATDFLAPADAGFSRRLAGAVPERVAAAVAAVLLVSVALPSQVGMVQERERVGAARRELAALEPRAGTLERFRAARAEEARAQDALDRLGGGQVLWSYLLRDLSHRVGPDVRLAELAVVEPPAGTQEAVAAGTAPPSRAVRMSGQLYTGARRAEDVVSELMFSLERSPLIDGVALEECAAVNRSLCSFTLTARLAE